MSKNIDQVFIANPITSNAATDLMYFGQSPYGAGDDAAMTYANFALQFGAPYTPAALTRTNDTNVTLTLGGTPATALLHATSLTLGWSGQLALTRGGTNNSLTASNGGVVWSDATKLNILAGTATADLPLLSGSTATPSWGSFALSLGGALTTAGAVTTVGAFGTTFTFTNTTNVTFPISGTLATTSQLPTPAALTKTDDTNVTLTLGGTPATALLQATSLTLGWTGILSPTRGGTGVNNGSNTLTLAGNLATSGAFASTFTMTAPTTVTFPTSGTLATTSQLPTPAALTKTDDTNVTITLGGTPSTALLQATSLTMGWTGQLGLTRGGSNASLTANDGGIVYSTASAMAILAGTATANQVLLSGSSTTPAWSTASYPATTTINQLLYSSSANTIAGLATANNGILVTSAGGVPSIGNTVGAGLTMPSVTFNSTSGIIGTTTNDNAAAGSVGEFLDSTLSAFTNYGTSGTVVNQQTLALTAGDWDVYGLLIYSANGATGTFINGGLSLTSASITPVSSTAQYNLTNASGVAVFLGNNTVFIFGRVSIAAPSTLYLVGQATYGFGAPQYAGAITARRFR
jgi:hypothetical protein